MNQLTFIKKGIGLAGLALLIAFPAKSAMAAFGISPAYIKYDYLKPGTTYSQTITLSTNDSSQQRSIRPEITGDAELLNWVVVETNGGVMPAGQTQVPIQVNINVPQNAVEKRYTGNITIVLEPKENVNGLDINLGGNIKLDLAVSRKTYVDYVIRSMSLPSIQEGALLPLRMFVVNKGNEDLKEMPVELEIWSQNEKTLIAKKKDSTLSSAVPAYKSSEVIMNFESAGVPAGQYWAKVRVLKGGKSVFEGKTFLEIQPLLPPTTQVNTMLRVRGEAMQGNISSAASVGTSLRVKSPYEDPVKYTAIALIALLILGYGYRQMRRR